MPKSCVVTAVAVMSLDGYIAKEANDPIQWSSPEDKKQLHDFLQKQTDICVMGRKSFDLCQSVFIGRYPVLVLSRQYSQPTQIENGVWGVNPETIDLLAYCSKNFGPRVTWLGGQQIYTYGFAHGLIDILRLTIEPILLGRGIALCAGIDLPRMTITSSEILNDRGTLLINYEVSHAH